MARYLFIVSREDRALYEVLARRFADDPNAEVILDRRVRTDPPAPYSGPERRMRPEINNEIQQRAYAIVILP
jgi:hypothetical protein